MFLLLLLIPFHIPLTPLHPALLPALTSPPTFLSLCHLPLPRLPAPTRPPHICLPSHSLSHHPSHLPASTPPPLHSHHIPLLIYPSLIPVHAPPPLFSLLTVSLSSFLLLSLIRDLKFSVSCILYRTCKNRPSSEVFHNNYQVHGLAQAFAEVVQLLPLDAAIVVVTLAKPKSNLEARSRTPVKPGTYSRVAVCEPSHVIVVATGLPVTSQLQVGHRGFFFALKTNHSLLRTMRKKTEFGFYKSS